MTWPSAILSRSNSESRFVGGECEFEGVRQVRIFLRYVALLCCEDEKGHGTKGVATAFHHLVFWPRAYSRGSRIHPGIVSRFVRHPSISCMLDEFMADRGFLRPGGTRYRMPCSTEQTCTVCIWDTRLVLRQVDDPAGSTCNIDK